NSAAAQPPPKSTQTGSAKPGKLDSGKAKTKQAKAKKRDKAVDPNARTKEGKSVTQLQDEKLAKTGGTAPQGAKDEQAKTTDNLEAKVKAGLAPIHEEATPEEVASVIASVYTTYQPKGLKALYVEEIPGKTGQFEIFMVASPRREAKK